MGRVTQVLIQVIARTAGATKDPALTALLAKHGVHLGTNAQTSGADEAPLAVPPPEAGK